ncbi:hypothetical protein [Pseudomonas sp. Q1-7]|nr:hypothetical protein [Pseudomonas sp. Q1-7]
MNHEHETVENCGAPSGVSADDWQAMEWQLMALALDADEAGAEQ